MNTEGFAFFAWHRLIYRNGPYTCRSTPAAVSACIQVWRDGKGAWR